MPKRNQIIDRSSLERTYENARLAWERQQLNPKGGRRSLAAWVFLACYWGTENWCGPMTQRQLVKKVRDLFESRSRMLGSNEIQPDDMTIWKHVKVWLRWRQGYNPEQIEGITLGQKDALRGSSYEPGFFALMRMARDITDPDPPELLVFLGDPQAAAWAADQATLTKKVRAIRSPLPKVRGESLPK